MSADRETISVYDRQADEYASRFAGKDHPQLDAFIAALPKGTAVLDLGCGPGHAAERMQEAGLIVDALDASPEMVARACARGVPARQALFSAPLDPGAYGGVWASFSLLHAPRAEMPGHLASIHAALTPGGLIVLGLKTGEGERRDALGRHYTYYSESELDGLLKQAGFRITSHERGEGKGLAGTVDPWIVVTARA